jgi:5-methylcytosine-specific restriction protein B
MAWLTPRRLELVSQFMEPNPIRNEHGHLKTRSLSFYSSELKSFAQVLDAALRISRGEALHNTARTAQRYRNTLTNQDLLVEGANADTLSATGVALLAELNAKHLTPNDLDAEHLAGGNLAQAADLEGVVCNRLLDRVLAGRRGEKPVDYFLDLLYNVQLFWDAVPAESAADLLSGTNDSLQLLYFLQCIHSVGFEVSRFFRLSSQVRQEAMQAWQALGTSPEFPEDPGPARPWEQAAFTYTRPIARNTIQSDIRYRIHCFLTAHSRAKARFGVEFPRLTPDLEIANRTHIARAAAAQYALSLRPTRVVLPHPVQRLVTGCPGSGKSELLRKDATADGSFVIRTTFHSESSYFDFVGTYKPVPLYEKRDNAKLSDAAGVAFTAGIPHVTYRYVPGPFTQAYLTAVQNPNWNVVLIIEELNRANPSAVFGDMFQLLDRNESTGQSAHSTMPNPDLAAFLAEAGSPVPAEGIRLPGNMYIWATMNSADQGVFPLDSAFRRRWNFEYLGYLTPCAYPADQARLRYNGQLAEWDRFRQAINRVLIAEHIHEDKLIGPYFLSLAELANPDRVLHKLFLYLWEDVLRFQHEKLMPNYKAFSDLVKDWNDGAGAPLRIDLG